MFRVISQFISSIALYTRQMKRKILPREKRLLVKISTAITHNHINLVFAIKIKI